MGLPHPKCRQLGAANDEYDDCRAYPAKRTEEIRPPFCMGRDDKRQRRDDAVNEDRITDVSFLVACADHDTGHDLLIIQKGWNEQTTQCEVRQRLQTSSQHDPKSKLNT